MSFKQTYQQKIQTYILELNAYLKQLDELDRNPNLSELEKTQQLEIINSEIEKIGRQIDEIKARVTLVASFDVN